MRVHYIKNCSNPDCLQTNPQPLDNFHNAKAKSDGKRSRCKSCELAKATLYRERNRQLLLDKERERRERDPEAYRVACRLWRSRNPGKVAEYNAEYHETNAESRAEAFRLWRIANPEKMLEKSRRRRARKLAAEGSFTESEFQAKLVQYDSHCHWCGKKMSGDEVTRDHVVPLARGGRDDIQNVVPSCYNCNVRKRTKSPLEFAGRLF